MDIILNDTKQIPEANDDLYHYPPPNPEWPINLDAADYYYISDIDAITTKWYDDPAFIPTTLVYSLTFIIGIFGNAMVVIGLFIDKKAQTATNTFLISLAVADLLFLFLVVPYEMAFKFAGYWTGIQVFCKLSAFIEMWTALASIWNLAATSIERYIVIVHPLKTRTICSLGNTRKIIVMVWSVALLLSAPTLYVYNTEIMMYYNIADYVVDTVCTITIDNVPAIAWYQFLVMFLIPTLIMIFCYSRVIFVLWLSTRELAKLTHRERNQERASLTTKCNPSPVNKDQGQEMIEARKQVIRMLLTIIMVFLVCWGPKLILHLLKSYSCKCLHNSKSFIAVIIISLLPYIQSSLNPIIYSFMSKNFRQSMLKVFQICCPCMNILRRRNNAEFITLDKYKTNMSYNSTHMHAVTTYASEAEAGMPLKPCILNTTTTDTELS